MRGEIIKGFSRGFETVELVNFFDPLDIFIEGREMVRRAKALHAMVGLGYVDVMIDHSEKISEWGEYDLVLAGARMRKKIANREYEFVAYLRKSRGFWRLGYGNIDGDWDLRARLVRCAPLF